MSLDFKTFFYDANILRLEIRILHYLKSIRDANTSLSIWCTACVELKSTNSESSNLFLLNDALHIAHTYTHQLIVLYNTVTIKRFSWFFKSKPIVCYQFNKVVLLVRPTIGTATKINCYHRISKRDNPLLCSTGKMFGTFIFCHSVYIPTGLFTGSHRLSMECDK